VRDPLILVAEDEAGLRRLLVRTLQRAGFRADAQPDGAQAEACLRADPTGFAGAVVDLVLPPNGSTALLDALAELRPELPVVLTSGAAPGPEHQAYLARGNVSFLAKPFSPQQLLARLRASRARDSAD